MIAKYIVMVLKVKVTNSQKFVTFILPFMQIGQV